MFTQKPEYKVRIRQFSDMHEKHLPDLYYKSEKEARKKLDISKKLLDELFSTHQVEMSVGGIDTRVFWIVQPLDIHNTSKKFQETLQEEFRKQHGDAKYTDISIQGRKVIE